MCKLFAIPVLQNSLHQGEIKPAHPIRQAVLTKNREDLPPAIHIAVHVGDGGDFHKSIGRRERNDPQMAQNRRKRKSAITRSAWKAPKRYDESILSSVIIRAIRGQSAPI